MFGHGYWDVLVEYAKESPDELLVRIGVTNRGDRPAKLHLPRRFVPQHVVLVAAGAPAGSPSRAASAAGHLQQWPPPTMALGECRPGRADNSSPLFTENETNWKRCFGVGNASPFVKDGINGLRRVHGRHEAVNLSLVQASAHYLLQVGPGRTCVVRLRLSRVSAAGAGVRPRLRKDLRAPPVRGRRILRVDHAPSVGPDASSVTRQRWPECSGASSYYYDISRWLRDRLRRARRSACRGHPGTPSGLTW